MKYAPASDPLGCSDAISASFSVSTTLNSGIGVRGEGNNREEILSRRRGCNGIKTRLSDNDVDVTRCMTLCGKMDYDDASRQNCTPVHYCVCS